jgi:hypothetical protein
VVHLQKAIKAAEDGLERGWRVCKIGAVLVGVANAVAQQRREQYRGAR